jgi:hypothetical protein
MTVSSSPALPRDLGGGLTLRRATPADVDAVVTFNRHIHDGEFEQRGELPRVSVWVRDLAEDTHPTFRVADFLVVEDTATGKIVSSSNLISQTWFYEDIPFPVGRPELVGTLEEYRNRGLVRATFDGLHALSAERGELLQGITGIPYYYRQFGYEMAVSLDGGRDYFVPQQIPALPKDQSEPVNLRPATEADLPFLVEASRLTTRRCALSACWDADLFRHEISGKRPENVNVRVPVVIETPAGQPVGIAAHPNFLWGDRIALTFIELLPGQSWFEIVPAVMRYLVKVGQSYAAQEKDKTLGRVFFALGAQHPAYDVLTHLSVADPRAYTWYLRVPDLPGFIRHVAPVLERRLANSNCAGLTVDIPITFYRGGLRLAFEKGRLTVAEPLSIPWGDANAAFPGLTFLIILFGHRSLDEVMYAFPDCWRNRELGPVFDALFPRMPSAIWPIS